MHWWNACNGSTGITPLHHPPLCFPPGHFGCFKLNFRHKTLSKKKWVRLTCLVVSLWSCDQFCSGAGEHRDKRRPHQAVWGRLLVTSRQLVHILALTGAIRWNERNVFMPLASQGNTQKKESKWKCGDTPSRSDSTRFQEDCDCGEIETKNTNYLFPHSKPAVWFLSLLVFSLCSGYSMLKHMPDFNQ